MRIVALINEREVIERILRHPGLWEPFLRAVTARAPPGELFVRAGSDPRLDYGFPFFFSACLSCGSPQ